eukprot:scpid87742/ scgid5540/ 
MSSSWKDWLLPWTTYNPFMEFFVFGQCLMGGFHPPQNQNDQQIQRPLCGEVSKPHRRPAHHGQHQSSKECISTSQTTPSYHSTSRATTTSSAIVFERLSAKDPFVQLDTKTLHVSCRSDRLQLTGSCNAVGMVLWSYNELKEWSVSGVRCKSGYVYVKRLSAITLEEHQDERDQVHGRLYASLFRGDFGSVVTATGFDLYQGAWTWFSGRLDISSGKWVDRREASQLEQDLILLSYRTWINGGPQNNAIADLRDRIRY